MMKAGFAAALAALALAGCAEGNAQPAEDSVHREMLDRVAIHDLVARYYANLGGGDPASFNDYYTEDAVFDVNGIVARGKQEIEGIYAGLGEESPAARGTFHMLLTNPVIDVEGDTATARFLWTGIINETIEGPPALVEQGREYDYLVRQDGRWLIKKRVVIADSGLPESMKATYTARKDYDIAADLE